MSESTDRPRPLVAIVDDEEDIITFLRLALEDHGFEVTSTSTSDGALELLEEAQPDLVCLDLLMPRQTGVSLYSEIKNNPKTSDCPVVIMSGLASRHELGKMFDGVGEPSALIEKPINIDEMIDTIDRLIERQSGEAS